MEDAMSTMWAYNDKVKEHFVNPKNILAGDEDNYPADGKGLIGSPACGDMMMVLIRVDEDKITDLKWKTFGCASAIGSTSALSEMVMRDGGMTIKEAYSLTPEKIIAELGGLPSNKIHCSVLGDKALRAAIDDYYEKRNEHNPYKNEDVEVVCECLNITAEDIRMEVLEGAKDFNTLQERTKISSMCGNCRERAQELQAEYVKRYYSTEIYHPEEKQ